MEDGEDNKANPDVDLEGIKVISQFYEKNDDDNEKSKIFDLPTPESLEKLCSPQVVKDCVTLNIIKYKSFFVRQKKEGSDNEITVLNLDRISSIKNGEV